MGLFNPSIGSGEYIVSYGFSGGCSDTDYMNITVLPADSINVELLDLCLDADPVLLPNPSTGYWSGYGLIGNNPAIFDPSIVGIGEVTLAYVNPNNLCVDSQLFNFQVNPLPEIDIFAEEDRGCSPLFTILYNANSYPNNYGVYWSVDGGDIFLEDTVEYTFLAPGYHTVSLTLTDSNGCTSIEVNDTAVLVYPNPKASFVSAVDENDYSLVHFHSTSLHADEFLWSFGSTKEDPSLQFANEEGEELICLYVRSDEGCQDSTCNVIEIVPPFYVYIPNTFTPNGNGVNELFYPKMSTSEDIRNYRFTILNRWGDKIWETDQQGVGWDGENCKQDVYSWKLYLEHTKTGTIFEDVGKVTLLR